MAAELGVGCRKPREGLVRPRIAGVRGDVEERAQRERSLEEPRVRDLEPRFGAYFAVNPQHVQVNGSRPPAH